MKLLWTLTNDESLKDPDKDGYWKIIGHFGCRMNGKKGRPKKGAKEDFMAGILTRRAAAIVKKRWPPKSSPVSPKKVTQLSLFS
ncbi:MAG: hypothetical protein PHQ42_01360 [Patescibacteria group bacterium]|nr:hypothetical protein [Patescibacteria group bacterium]